MIETIGPLLWIQHGRAFASHEDGAAIAELMETLPRQQYYRVVISNCWRNADCLPRYLTERGASSRERESAVAGYASAVHAGKPDEALAGERDQGSEVPMLATSRANRDGLVRQPLEPTLSGPAAGKYKRVNLPIYFPSLDHRELEITPTEASPMGRQPVKLRSAAQHPHFQ